MGGFGLLIFDCMLLGLTGALITALVIAIVKRSKTGVAVSGLLLICIMSYICALCLCPFNLWGLLTKEPVPLDLVAEYKLDGGWSSSYIAQMGYKKLSGRITLNSDATFFAKDIPACCVHGTDETREPFSGGYYTFHGTWRIAKQQSVYIVDLSISQITGENVPSDAELNRYFMSRVPRQNLRLDILRGNPFSVGFSVFNGDFDDIVFSREKPETSGAAKTISRRN